MNEHGREQVDQLHQEAMERYREQEAQGRQVVEAMIHEAFEREWHERQGQRGEQAQREANERGRVPLAPPREPVTIPYTELPDGQPDSPIAAEWNFYRREVGRLLAEGQEGRWVLIKGEEIMGIWDRHDDARAVALQKYVMQPCLIQQIRSREPVVRMSARFWGCQQ
jgi:hypothetical protein